MSSLWMICKAPYSSTELHVYILTHQLSCIDPCSSEVWYWHITHPCNFNCVAHASPHEVCGCKPSTDHPFGCCDKHVVCHNVASDFHCLYITRAYNDVQNAPVWRDTTCATHIWRLLEGATIITVVTLCVQPPLLNTISRDSYWCQAECRSESCSAQLQVKPKYLLG